MKARLKAFALHLTISAIVVASALTLILGFWYPDSFAYVQDVYDVVATLISVDLVVGPLLTLIVYNPAKKLLKMDLTLIGLMQVGALVYGLVVCYQNRPVYVVYNDGVFATVIPDEFIDSEVKLVKGSPYLKPPATGMQWIASVAPANISKRDALFVEYYEKVGGGLRLMPRFYVPYAKAAADAARRGKLASELSFTAGQKPQVPKGWLPRPPTTEREVKAVQQWLGSFGLPLDKIVVLPLQGPEQTGMVALEAGSGKILGNFGQHPWWTAGKADIKK